MIYHITKYSSKTRLVFTFLPPQINVSDLQQISPHRRVFHINFTTLTPSDCRYFASFIISCHKPLSVSNFHLHLHLHRRLMLVFLMSFTPKPPFFLLLHIICQRINLYLFLVLPLAKKTFFFVCPIHYRFRQQVHGHVVNKGIRQS